MRRWPLVLIAGSVGLRLNTDIRGGSFPLSFALRLLSFSCAFCRSFMAPVRLTGTAASEFMFFLFLLWPSHRHIAGYCDPVVAFSPAGALATIVVDVP